MWPFSIWDKKLKEFESEHGLSKPQGPSLTGILFDFSWGADKKKSPPKLVPVDVMKELDSLRDSCKALREKMHYLEGYLGVELRHDSEKQYYRKKAKK
jgi:hypothetical protein